MPNWNTDAQFVHEISEDSLFKNPRIDGFLKKESYAKFILVASKGMGKTLLIRHKRKSIEEGNRSIFIIPRNETADYVNLPASIGKEFLSAMSEQIFWEDIWKLSISISALLSFPHNISKTDQLLIAEELSRAGLPGNLRKELLRAFNNENSTERKPSSVLDILLQSGKSTLENSRSTGLQIISEIFNTYISSACFIFIDSFDQALAHNFPDNLNIWCAAQTGLMKASWELSRHNRHVKVFTTIRYEAYSSFTDTERLNISGSVLLIEYSKEDLKGIFEVAISSYENCSTIEEFVGFKSMYNGFLKTHENVFEYIYRHTIGVPRWLMKIGEELSNIRRKRGLEKDNRTKKNLQRTVAEVVNRVSAEDLAYEHLRSEMKMFFKGDDPQQFFDKFISKINSSILSLANVKWISEKFILDNPVYKTKHPFCLMYNLGFIGYIGGNSVDKQKQQIFKRPYQFNWNLENILPINPNTHYLIHPSLHHMIQKRNYHFNFNMVRIGEGLNGQRRKKNKFRKKL